MGRQTELHVKRPQWTWISEILFRPNHSSRRATKASRFVIDWFAHKQSTEKINHNNAGLSERKKWKQLEKQSVKNVLTQREPCTLIRFEPSSRLVRFGNAANPSMVVILFCARYKLVRAGISGPRFSIVRIWLKDKSSDLLSVMWWGLGKGGHNITDYMKHDPHITYHDQIITKVRKIPEMREMGHILNALDNVFIQVQFFNKWCLNPFDALNFILPQNQILKQTMATKKM